MRPETYFGKERDELRKVVKSKIDYARKENVEFVKYQFADMQGQTKEVTLTLDAINNIGETSTDGSSIYGKIIPPTESDMMLIPDFETFQIIPWMPKTSRVICSVFYPRESDGKSMKPFEGCGRNILSKVERSIQPILRKAFPKFEISKFHAHFSPEIEFIVVPLEYDYLNIHKDTKLRNNHYFIPPKHNVDLFLQEVTQCLKAMGLKREKFHTEVATYQYEIGIGYGNVLSIADATMTARYIIESLAFKHGLRASFVPKFFSKVNGSGMHVHQSWAITVKGKEINVFYDAKRENGMSEIFNRYAAGQLKYAKEITSFINSGPMSFKRLVPDAEAPTKISFDWNNRTALLRGHSPRSAKNIRIEYRAPDSKGNPYLAFAAMLSAGIAGNEEKLVLPSVKKKNYYHDEKTEQLPATFGEAIEKTRGSAMLKKYMGKEIVKMYCDLGMHEWRDYCQQISDVDVERYF
jgi:glutamine synthetase